MPAYPGIARIKDGAEKRRVIERLLLLREQLDRQIPAKTATDTLLLATWNIRAFSDNRREESLRYIAEIISRFDLVAVQEVSSDLGGLQKLAALLGHNWDYIVTDSSAAGERMAFVYDRCKVFFRKIAGELVLADNKLLTGNLQFARTPFSVAFQAGWFRFMLTTVHIFYGSDAKAPPRRVEEIDAVADAVTRRAKKQDENYILLGDFNIYNAGDATMQALENRGFHIPAAIREHPTSLKKARYYDQIAFKLKIDTSMVVFSEDRQRAGAFNFTESVYTPQDLGIYRAYFEADKIRGKSEEKLREYYMDNWRTFEMSDHLPLWVELKIDFSNQYLERIAKAAG